MATAKKLPSGSWRTLVFDYTDIHGKKHYRSFTADTKRESEFLASEYLLNADRDKKDVTLNHCIGEYIELRKEVLSPVTVRDYTTRYEYLKENYPKIIGKRLSEIRNQELQEVINDLAKDKKPKTVIGYYNIIRISAQEYNKTFKVKLPKKQKTQYHIPTEYEVKKLLNAIHGGELEIPVLLASSCLLRRGEICALKPSDLDGNRLHIHSTMVKDTDGSWLVKEPKTVSSDRYIQIPQYLADLIRQRGYITHMTPDTLYNNFTRTLKRNNIPHFRFHDLRHYGTSLYHTILPDSYLQKMGGWSNAQTMQNVYRHVLSDYEKGYADMVNEEFYKKFKV